MKIDQVFDGSDAHLLPSNPAECADILRRHNAWRRGNETIEMMPPAEIGLAIDMAIELIEREETYAAQAKRLAMELECLLISCKDTAAVSKWWDSAHEALAEFRKISAEACS